MIIRYCLSLASKSPAAYDEVRYDANKGTGFVILPSRWRLRNYKNYIKPQRGFNQEIIQELRSKIKIFSEQEEFVVILMDKTKIQENLVRNKHTAQLCNITQSQRNYIPIMVSLVRSIVNRFKFSLANFVTKDMQASQIFHYYGKLLGYVN